jgi:hypothetical protein
MNLHIFFLTNLRCGLLIGPDPKYDELIKIDGLPDFTYTRASGEPEDNWGESMCFLLYAFVSFPQSWKQLLRYFR